MFCVCCSFFYSYLFYVVLLLSSMCLHAMPILTEESEKHPSACLNDEKALKGKASDESISFEKKWKSPLKIDDLCAVQELLGQASSRGINIIKRWFNLGLALGLDYNHLRYIKQNSSLSEEEACTVMLSCWLNQTNMRRFDQHEEREPNLYDLVNGVACIGLNRDACCLYGVCLGEDRVYNYNSDVLVMEYLLRYREAVKSDIEAGRALNMPLDLSHLFVLWQEMLVIVSKARTLGLALGLSYSEVEMILANNRGAIEVGLQEMIATWLKTADDTKRTRQYIIDALRTGSIGQNKAAMYLTKRYSTDIKEDDVDAKRRLWQYFSN